MGWQCPIPVPQPVDAGEGRVLVTGGYSAGTAMFQVQKKGDGSYGVTELFKNPDFGAHTQPPLLYKDHFYSHFTVNERSDGLVAMSMDGQIKWKTDQEPAFVRGGSILADGLLLTTDGNTKLYLVEPDPSGFKPIASAVVLEPGDNWAPLALVDGKLLVRGQKQLKCVAGRALSCQLLGSYRPRLSSAKRKGPPEALIAPSKGPSSSTIRNNAAATDTAAMKSTLTTVALRGA